MISVFTNVLKDYGFYPNSEKTEICDFPYYLVKNFETYLKYVKNHDISDSEIIETFNSFSEMENEGTKGAIRYLLKSFEKNPPKVDTPDLYKAYLITIMANDERSLTKACSILISQKDKYQLLETDLDVIKNLLKKHISKQYDLEVIWLLYLLIETNNVEFGCTLCELIANCNNELAHVILFRKNLFNDKQLAIIKSKAKSWILIYEFFVSDSITEDEFTSRLNVKNNLEMYRFIKNLNIHFVQFNN